MFLIQIEVLEVLSIFSKYTPLNPLLKQAKKIAIRPTILMEVVMTLADSVGAVDEPLGH